MMTANQTHVLYVLKCDHVVLIAPNLLPKDLHPRCPECKEFIGIRGIHVYEWHARCEVCTYGRWTGLSEALAARLVGAHGRATMHLARVRYERNPSSVKELERLRRAKEL